MKPEGRGRIRWRGWLADWQKHAYQAAFLTLLGHGVYWRTCRSSGKCSLRRTLVRLVEARGSAFAGVWHLWNVWLGAVSNTGMKLNRERGLRGLRGSIFAAAQARKSPRCGSGGLAGKRSELSCAKRRVRTQRTWKPETTSWW